MNKSKILLISVFVIAIGAVGFFGFKSVGNSIAPGDYDEFATCLNDSGATFYGAWWCPHCKDQKDMFGNSFRLLDYVECSSPGQRNQLSVCSSAGITGYPTWEFGDGTRASGALSFDQLSQSTGCEILGGEVNEV